MGSGGPLSTREKPMNWLNSSPIAHQIHAKLSKLNMEETDAVRFP